MRILVIEPDSDLADVLAFGLRRQGFQVSTASQADLTSHIWWGDGFDAILLAAGSTVASSLDLLRDLRATGNWTPVVLLSLTRDARLREEATRLGIVAVLPKPFLIRDLIRQIRALREPGASQKFTGPDEPNDGSFCEGA